MTDYYKISLDEMPLFDELGNKSILITGATGLIGSAIVNSFLSYNEHSPKKIHAILYVRNMRKALDLFGDRADISYIEGDICNPLSENIKVDYIIHAASQTSSKAFVQNPVEVALTSILGTKNMLEFAIKSEVNGFVYLSSMEVYGTPQTDEKISELTGTNLDTMQVRSSYPESKRICESLCCSYAAEYHVPSKVVRLTQTFGPGVLYNDGRVFAEFARCAIEGKNIILHTKGETRRSYLYVQDAVTAILTVLLKGKAAEAYNAANEETYCSIREMAEMVAHLYPQNPIVVQVQEESAETHGYAPTLHMNLDTSKLRGLGWTPKTGLAEMFCSMIGYMRKSN